MPIRPENKKLYPPDWKEIRESILARAGGKCEWCGVPNHHLGARDVNGKWWESREIHVMKSDVGMALFGEDFPGEIRIILTVAHLDHDPTKNAADNLAALCQKCHNGYDAKHRAAGIKGRRAAAAGQETFI